MKPYPKYKDSDIEWIGEIPEHWKLSKFKYCILIKNGYQDPFCKSLLCADKINKVLLIGQFFIVQIDF